MKIYKIDWRYNSIRSILDTLSDELIDVVSKIDPDEPDSNLELSNSLMGIAFITAQVYIAGTAADVNKLINPSTVKKVNLFKDFSVHIPDSEITEIELCNTMANYFKHHDEWSFVWSQTKPERPTIKVLRAVGIDQNDNYPCIKAGDMLFSNTSSPPSFYLPSLFSMIVEWRKKVMDGLDNYR